MQKDNSVVNPFPSTSGLSPIFKIYLKLTIIYSLCCPAIVSADLTARPNFRAFFTLHRKRCPLFEPASLFVSETNSRWLSHLSCLTVCYLVYTFIIPPFPKRETKNYEQFVNAYMSCLIGGRKNDREAFYHSCSPVMA